MLQKKLKTKQTKNIVLRSINIFVYCVFFIATLTSNSFTNHIGIPNFISQVRAQSDPTPQPPANFGGGLQNPAAGGSLLQQAAGGNLDVLVGNNALTGLELLISRIIGFLTTLAGIFFIFYFILGALSWVTAGGDTGKTQKARDQIVQGVIGLVIIVGSYAVIGIIGSVVGIDILNPAAQLQTIFGI